MLNSNQTLQDERMTHEMQRLIMELHALKEPNSPDGKSYMVELPNTSFDFISEWRGYYLPVNSYIDSSFLYMDEIHKHRLDKMLTEPPKVEKQFRDNHNRLSVPTCEVEKATKAQADWYYKSGNLYFHKGKVCECIRDTVPDSKGNQIEQIRFICGKYTTFCDPERMGTFLPDIAGEGMEIIALNDARLKIFYPPPERKRHTYERAEPEPER